MKKVFVFEKIGLRGRDFPLSFSKGFWKGHDQEWDPKEWEDRIGTFDRRRATIVRVDNGRRSSVLVLLDLTSLSVTRLRTFCRSY